MLKSHLAIFMTAFSLTAPVSAQISGTEAQTRLPGTTRVPDAGVGTTAVTPPPGVTDPTTTNSTTGTVDQEDHCQPPGTSSNTNPTADTPASPRPEPACR